MPALSGSSLSPMASQMCAYYIIIIVRHFTSPSLNFQRPPVEWEKTPPREATYIFPYVILWSEVTTQVLVYNLLDQQCVQEIPFPVSLLSLSLSLLLLLLLLKLDIQFIGAHISSRMVAILATFLASSTQLTIALSTTSLKSPSRNK